MNGAASPRIRKTMVFVLLALFLGQFGSGVYDLVFSNFLRDAQHLDVEMRGLIEFPRELPGILSLFVVSLLFMFNEVRVAGVACLLMFGGMYALAFCGAGTSLWTLSAWILTVSLGQHILMGMIDTIVIHTARPENRSLRLGQMKALGTAAALLGALAPRVGLVGKVFDTLTYDQSMSEAFRPEEELSFAETIRRTEVGA